MVSRTLYAGFLAVVALERLVELTLSRRNARRAFVQGAVEVGGGHFPPMAVMHGAFLVACPLEVFALRRPFPGTLGWASLCAAVLAQGLRYWAVVSLGVRWNVRIIVWPEAPVTKGPYRFLRHPNYSAVALEFLSLPLIHGAWICAAVFSVANALVLTIRIRSEESALGASYASAFSGRPRLIPLLGPGG